MRSYQSALRQAGKLLKEHGVETPALDAGLLLSHITGHDRAGLYRLWDSCLSPEEDARFFALIRRRCSGEPVAYLTGHKEFMGLDFDVNPSVLIPRPETELLVEAALKHVPARPVIVDVGTGSGAIGVSLARFVPEAVVYAIDCSAEALAIARRNAARHGVAHKIVFCLGDLLEPLADCTPAQGNRVDLITANLPYIAQEDLPGLPREVRLFEPVLALDGGTDGLELYRRLIPQAAVHLKQGGSLLLEIGAGQGPSAEQLLPPPLWEVAVLKDLAGLDRLVRATYCG